MAQSTDTGTFSHSKHVARKPDDMLNLSPTICWLTSRLFTACVGEQMWFAYGADRDEIKDHTHHAKPCQKGEEMDRKQNLL